MKKSHIVLLAACLLIAVTNGTFAQSSSNHLYAKNEAVLKRIATGSLIGDESTAISVKALRHFKDIFKDTTGSRWYTVRDGFVAKINRDNMDVRMGYDNRGNWEYSIHYYTEEKLPFEVRDMVKREYYDYKIDVVEEIDIKRNGLYYLVHMHDKQSWKNVLVHEGELSLVKDMEK